MVCDIGISRRCTVFLRFGVNGRRTLAALYRRGLHFVSIADDVGPIYPTPDPKVCAQNIRRLVGLLFWSITIAYRSTYHYNCTASAQLRSGLSEPTKDPSSPRLDCRFDSNLLHISWVSPRAPLLASLACKNQGSSTFHSRLDKASCSIGHLVLFPFLL